MKLTRRLKGDLIFLLFFIVLSLALVSVKLYWIHHAVRTKAIVLRVAHTRYSRYRQFYPVVQYETHQYIVTTTGTYNMIGDAGDTLDILYNPDHPTSFRINTPFWLWLDIWSWYRVLLVFMAFYYILRFLVRKTLPNQQQGIIKDAS